MWEKWLFRAYAASNFLAVVIAATYAFAVARCSVWTLAGCLGVICLAAGVVAIVERLAGD